MSDPRRELTSSPSAPLDKRHKSTCPRSMSVRKSKLDVGWPMTARKIGFEVNFETLFNKGAIDSSRKRLSSLSYVRKKSCMNGSETCLIIWARYAGSVRSRG